MTPFLTSFQRLYVNKQFVKFLAVGGVAALLHWLARFVFDVFVEFGVAVILAYAVGIIVAFILNRIFVFPKSIRPMRHEIAIFTIVNIAAFPLVVGISISLGTYLLPHALPRELAKAVGHGAGVLSPVFINFAAHKWITFRTEDRR